jgi:hypothetical protein
MKFVGLVRGAAIPETALVLSFLLVVVLGAIQMGVVGGLQLMADGAAFVGAHEYSLNYAKSAAANQQTVTNIFPQINSLPIAVASNAPTIDPADVSVAYPTNQSARSGGTSLLRPSNLQATVNATGDAGILARFLNGASTFGVHGSAIEPLNWQTNSQYDVAGTGYTSSTPLVSSFFGSAQDVPFSYVSMSRMSVCLEGGGKGVQPLFGLTCPNSDQQILALGSAEFLDQDNWGRSAGNNTHLGAGPFGSSPGSANTYLNTYTFAEMFCHQQYYAGLESYLVNAQRPSDIAEPAHTTGATPPPFLIGSMNTYDIINQDTGYGDTLSQLVHIYQWDATDVNASGSTTAAVGTPYTSASQYGNNQMHPGLNCT